MVFEKRGKILRDNKKIIFTVLFFVLVILAINVLTIESKKDDVATRKINPLFDGFNKIFYSILDVSASDEEIDNTNLENLIEETDEENNEINGDAGEEEVEEDNEISGFAEKSEEDSSSESNETENETIDLGNSNETAEPGEENVTIDLNETEENNSVSGEERTSKTLVSNLKKRGKIVINRPVKWVEVVPVEKLENEDVNVKIPKEAERVSVSTGREIDEAIKEIDDYEKIIEESDRKEIVEGTITGLISLDIESREGLIEKFLRWLKKITITGNAIDESALLNSGDIVENEEEKQIDLTKIVESSNANEVAIEYYTEAPTA